jgi:hypothetical protein
MFFFLVRCLLDIILQKPRFTFILLLWIFFLQSTHITWFEKEQRACQTKSNGLINDLTDIVRLRNRRGIDAN